MSPAGKETWPALLNGLLQGGFGENCLKAAGGRFPKSSWEQLPCIKNAIRRAKSKYAQATQENPKDRFNEGEYFKWAYEGLYAFSGARAFQVGYITPEEIKHFLKWTPDKESKMFHRGSKVRDPETGKLVDNEDWAFGDGLGWQSLMVKYGLAEDPNIDWDNSLWTRIIKKINGLSKQHPFIDYNDINTPAVKGALGENAYEARVLSISKHIYLRMRQELAKAREDKAQSLNAPTGIDSEGGEKKIGDVAAKGFSYDPNINPWEDEEKLGLIDPNVQNDKFGLPPTNVDLDEIRPKLALSFDDEDRPMPRVVGGTQPNEPGPATAQEPEGLEEPEGDALDSLLQRQPAKAPPEQLQEPAGMEEPEGDILDDLLQKSPSKQKRPNNTRKTPMPNQPNNEMGLEIDIDDIGKREHFISYDKWLKLKEVAGGPYDPRVKPHDGCGWNYWGAPGKTGGTSISGEADTASSDPTGKRGMKRYARRYQQSK